MRRRVALLSLATTTFVVVALLVPLGLLVRRQAEDRARVLAEREAQTAAGLVAVALDASAEQLRRDVAPLAEGQIISLPDGTVLGRPLPGQGTLVASARESQASITQVVNGGWEVALPVIGRDGAAIVDVFVPEAELRQGVAEAWALLGLLGLFLIGASVWIADRMGVSLVAGVTELAEAARRMGEGDLQARVEPSGPPEILEVGQAFNRLADRLDGLLVEERESVADMSHRLRTPLTSLRLQAEKIKDDRDRDDVLGHVARLERSIDQLIISARKGGRASPPISSLDEVVTNRADFWKVLAEEQGREVLVAAGAPGVEVAISAEDLTAVVDSLIDNVFTHTPPGVAFGLRTGVEGNRPWLEVIDEGPGFSDMSLLGRGKSGRGSTGLGLDIVRRTAEMAGGSVEMSGRPEGGARLRVWLATSPDPERSPA